MKGTTVQVVSVTMDSSESRMSVENVLINHGTMENKNVSVIGDSSLSRDNALLKPNKRPYLLVNQLLNQLLYQLRLLSIQLHLLSIQLQLLLLLLSQAQHTIQLVRELLILDAVA